MNSFALKGRQCANVNLGRHFPGQEIEEKKCPSQKLEKLFELKLYIFN